MTKKQWDLFNNALATATTLLSGRIAELNVRKGDASMYEQWMAEAVEAREALHELGKQMPVSVWLGEVA